ncbi:MAG TPA: DNA/RNA nuclease SfsA [Herpetosiphonaceae bacterium]
MVAGVANLEGEALVVDHVRVPLVGGASLFDATFLARPNRFVVEAQLATGERIAAHCADRGRLVWLAPGLPLLVGHKPGAGRKTAYQVAAAWSGGAWSSLDTHLPNRLIEHALRSGALPQFRAYTTIKREARHGGSRFDFLLADGARQCYVEVKSVGHVCGGVARFPDAPTERGRRHLMELAALAAAGVRTAVIFVAQHANAMAVTPDRAIDPAFADALRDVTRAGVEVYAYGCPIERNGITLTQQIPCVVEE